MKTKIGFISLGCSKNLVDTEMMLGLLREAGYEMTDSLEEADMIIVNTCTFIEAAKEESVNSILEAAEYKKTGHCRRLIVAGCLSQQFQKQLADEIPEIDILVGTNSWQHIIETIRKSEKGGQVLCFEDAPCMNTEHMPRMVTTPGYTSYLKIAEGCSNGCTFCYIPYVRGPMRSRSIASVAEEAGQLADRGVKELNVIAQDSSCYGRDLKDGTTLAGLLSQLVRIEGIHWIRLFYLYPTYFTDELLDLICHEKKICKYVDIPLQHISNGVLRRMNRKDTKESILTLLRKIRKAPVKMTIRTTLMVGFPGETEEEFQELCDFIKEIRFDDLGVFMYSPQEGTPAAVMEGQIPEDVKQARYHEIMSIQAKISEENDQDCIGQTAEALVEEIMEEENGKMLAKGRTSFQAPEVDGNVYIENPGALKPGDFTTVKITDGYAYDLIAEKI
jgi:ribosomal protein S12 methylthiotransferase